MNYGTKGDTVGGTTTMGAVPFPRRNRSRLQRRTKSAEESPKPLTQLTERNVEIRPREFIAEVHEQGSTGSWPHQPNQLSLVPLLDATLLESSIQEAA